MHACNRYQACASVHCHRHRRPRPASVASAQQGSSGGRRHGVSTHCLLLSLLPLSLSLSLALACMLVCAWQTVTHLPMSSTPPSTPGASASSAHASASVHTALGSTPEERRRVVRFLEQLCAGCGVDSCRSEDCATGRRSLRPLTLLAALFHAKRLAKANGVESCLPQQQQQQPSHVAADAGATGSSDAAAIGAAAAAAVPAAVASSVHTRTRHARLSSLCLRPCPFCSLPLCCLSLRLPM